MLSVTVNQATTLSMLASDGRTDLFGQARVYNSLGTLVATVNLNHVAEGLYAASYTPAVEGVFSVVYQFYTDAGRTVDANYERQGEALDVNSYRTNILRLLGLVHENSVIDQQVYDSNDNLLSARIRSYDTAANALAAGATGLRFTWAATGTYAGAGVLTSWTITTVP